MLDSLLDEIRLSEILYPAFLNNWKARLPPSQRRAFAAAKIHNAAPKPGPRLSYSLGTALLPLHSATQSSLYSPHAQLALHSSRTIAGHQLLDFIDANPIEIAKNTMLQTACRHCKFKRLLFVIISV